jgi:hypothetical protein
MVVSGVGVGVRVGVGDGVETASGFAVVMAEALGDAAGLLVSEAEPQAVMSRIKPMQSRRNDNDLRIGSPFKY